MTDLNELETEAGELRERFLALVAEVRPELHRYCSRMTGSVTDGEDVVQDSLAQAFYALPTMGEISNLRGWLFRIAHNKAIDFLRRYDVRHGESLEGRKDLTGDEEPEDPVVRKEIANRALSAFVQLLPPRERACVILKDVLDHSLAEVGDTLDMTVLAVKSALHRGRTKLRASRGGPRPAASPDAATSQVLKLYVELFNARDWDGVRDLLAEDVELDLVTVARRRGKEAVGRYFSNYERLDGWRVELRQVEGRTMAVLYESTEVGWQPRTLIRLRVEDGSVIQISDYRAVPYLLDELQLPTGDADL